MKKILLPLFVIVSISYTHAQTTQTIKRDSLHNALQKEKTDTGRVLLLAELSYQLHESRPDTALILALEALALSQQIGFEKGEAASLNRIGNVWTVLGNYPKAMEVFLSALKINEKLNNPEGLRRNYNNIGVIYRNQGDNQQALNYLFKAKELAEKFNDKEPLSLTLGNIGTNYLELKIIDSATLYSTQSYHLAYQINYDRQTGAALQVLGRINTETRRTTLALEYYRQSVPYLTKAENFDDLCFTYLGMAKLFEMIDQKDSAVFYAKKSLNIAGEKGFTLEVRDVGRFLTAFYRKRKMPDSALFYVDITKTANDSLFSEQKTRQLQSLAIDEKLRQADIAAAELKIKKKRSNNLQYAGLALGLISFIILFLLLSHSIIANQKLIRFLGVIALLIVFEFINLFIHPYLSHATNDSPLIMLLVMVCIAALLVPVHHRMEKWISHRLVEKNKKIRLDAAKKTIAKLEGEQTN